MAAITMSLGKYSQGHWM